MWFIFTTTPTQRCCLQIYRWNHPSVKSLDTRGLVKIKYIICEEVNGNTFLNLKLSTVIQSDWRRSFSNAVNYVLLLPLWTQSHRVKRFGEITIFQTNKKKKLQLFSTVVTLRLIKLLYFLLWHHFVFTNIVTWYPHNHKAGWHKKYHK